LPAFWRYIDQRFKATQQAYWFVISLQARKKISSTPNTRSDGLTHAGGIVFRKNKKATEFLLVQATKNRSQLVLPKGHIEPGEDPRVTAVREVKEETGHWARVTTWLKDIKLGQEDSAPMTRFFLMELEEKPREWCEENRQYEWRTFDANTPDLLPESQELLAEAIGKIG